MRTLVHLSDLHFGKAVPELLGPLREAVRRAGPDLVVVSGDLTQRARTREFTQARQFLDTLPSPRLVVPGNHDVPLYDVLRRALSPLGRYRRYITPELAPFHADGEVAVAGLSSARSLTIAAGRVNEQQLRGVQERLCALPAHVLRVVVVHHPLAVPDDHRHAPLGRRRLAVELLGPCRVDLFLSGHLHASEAAPLVEPWAPFGSLLVRAGTACSSRERGEPNSFNVLKLDPGSIEVQRYEWTGSAFVRTGSQLFSRAPAGWLELAASAAGLGTVRD